jgi:hypothetical protein
MSAQRRRQLLLAVAALAVVAAVLVIGTVVSGGTPDQTPSRVNADLAVTFANQWRLQQQILGRPASARFTATADCHHTPKGSRDRGPGTWFCPVTGHLPGATKPLEFTYIALVDGTSCYSALDSDLPPLITNKTTHKQVANPLVAFDSCFNVYDDRTE